MHHDTADNGMELLLTYPVAKWSYQVELDWSPVTQTDISLAWFFTSLTVKPRHVGFLLKNGGIFYIYHSPCMFRTRNYLTPESGCRAYPCKIRARS